jgi:KTSC domain/Thioredoxin
VERTPVESRLIRSVGYDLPSSILEIELVAPNRIYEYFDVPFSVYTELMEAESKGSYFNEYIKDMYAYQEVEYAPSETMTKRIVLDWSKVFAEALPYGSFLDRFANPGQRQRWDAMHGRFALTAEQRGLLSGFARRMPVLCLAGAWCGDCINQCPVFDHFARASARIDLRFLDRDVQPEVREALSINGGHRVPVVVFLSEDWYEVARYGERTLSIYRRMAADQLGPACPTGFVPPPDEALAAITAEWLAEFERAQLILRLSPRLRAMYGD